MSVGVVLLVLGVVASHAAGSDLWTTIGGPVIAAAIIAMGAAVAKLVSKRRQAREQEATSTNKTVTDLAENLKEVSLVLGGKPQTPFAGPEKGLVAIVADVTLNLGQLTTNVKVMQDAMATKSDISDLKSLINRNTGKIIDQGSNGSEQ